VCARARARAAEFGLGVAIEARHLHCRAAQRAMEINDLPDDALVLIFSLVLTSPTRAKELGLVCKNWHRILSCVAAPPRWAGAGRVWLCGQRWWELNIGERDAM